MSNERFSAFGTPLVEPDRLTMEELLRLVRSDLPAWQYGRCSPYVGRWLAAGIEAFLRDGADLARHLQLRPPKGSRATAKRIERQRERDALLLRLSVAAGTAARAQRILAGAEACPKRCVPLVEALKAHDIPRSRAAFTRAKRVSRLQR